ncbi:hypothetical protein OG900_38620 [Streptomyces sp. NBC_00433]
MATNIVKRTALLVSVAVVAFVVGWLVSGRRFPPAWELVTWLCICTVAVATGLWLRERRSTRP